MGWIVATANQASGIVEENEVTYHRNREEALDEARYRAEYTARVGRSERHFIARVEDEANWSQVGPDIDSDAEVTR